MMRVIEKAFVAIESLKFHDTATINSLNNLQRGQAPILFFGLIVVGEVDGSNLGLSHSRAETAQNAKSKRKKEQTDVL